MELVYNGQIRKYRATSTHPPVLKCIQLFSAEARAHMRVQVRVKVPLLLHGIPHPP